MSKISVNDLPVVGWREWISIPSLNIPKIKAKLDSGARTSALHAFNIVTKEENGKTFVYFKVHPIQKDAQTTVDCKAELVARRKIKSSNGKVQTRPIIRATISLMDEEYKIEISLASRDEMGFRMLLGREALRNRFNIASGVSFRDKTLIKSKKKPKKKKPKRSNSI